MNNQQIIYYALIVLVFIAAVIFIIGLGLLIAEHDVQKRLSQVLEQPGTKIADKNARVLSNRWSKILESLSKLSLPSEGWQDSSIHLKFLRAGLRDSATPKIYYAIKSLMTFGVPMIAGLLMWSQMSDLGLAKFALCLIAIAAIGYYLPEVYLDHRTKKRVEDTQHGLPDLIDLLVICTESGLGLDAALNRVSKEIARTNPFLAEEIYLTNLEIRAGAGRNQALKNFALRVNLDSVHNLVSMLVQADRFGTSVSESLRVQAEVMRIKRMQFAEEIASKIPVKMLLPMIFCIFPALLLVVIGPAMIQIKTLFN